MPRHAQIAVNSYDTPVELTANDIARITFQNRGAEPVEIAPSTDGTAPAATAPWIEYRAGEGEMNVYLVDLFPGLTAADRLFARARKPTLVSVSHA